MQSKKHSFFEANANTWIGLVGSLLIMNACMLLAPYVGVFTATNIGVAGCTVWSLVRGYGLRRVFNSRVQMSAVSEENERLIKELREHAHALHLAKRTLLEANRNGYVRGLEALTAINTVMQRHGEMIPMPASTKPLDHVQV